MKDAIFSYNSNLKTPAFRKENQARYEAKLRLALFSVINIITTDLTPFLDPIFKRLDPIFIYLPTTIHIEPLYLNPYESVLIFVGVDCQLTTHNGHITQSYRSSGQLPSARAPGQAFPHACPERSRWPGAWVRENILKGVSGLV